MAIDTNADFTPTIPDSGVVPVKSPYNPTGSFKFWVQKVIPLVYDDSLSYYELLCKVVNYLNNVIQNVDNLNDSVNSTNQSFETLKGYVNTTKDTLINTYNELQNYVNTYFDNLDVQEEINTKLDAMADSGELSTLLAPFIPDLVTQWLNKHVTPTSPVIDNTLSISGAGADAKVTGDKITVLTNDINQNRVFSLLSDADYQSATSKSDDNAYFTSRMYKAAYVQKITVRVNSDEDQEVTIYFYRKNGTSAIYMFEASGSGHGEFDIPVDRIIPCDFYISIRGNSVAYKSMSSGEWYTVANSQLTITIPTSGNRYYHAFKVYLRSINDELSYQTPVALHHSDVLLTTSPHKYRIQFDFINNKVKISNIYRADVIGNTVLSGEIPITVESTCYVMLLFNYQTYSLEVKYSSEYPHATDYNSLIAFVYYNPSNHALRIGNVNSDLIVCKIPTGDTNTDSSSYNNDIPKYSEWRFVTRENMKSQWFNTKMTFFGDSICKGENPENGYLRMADDNVAVMCAEEFGLAHSINLGIGGARVASVNATSLINRYGDIDNESDLVVIMGGTNDFLGGSPLGSLEDVSDNTQFIPAYYNLVNGIRTRMRSKKMLAVIPFHQAHISAYNGPYLDESTQNRVGLTLADYRNAIIEVCEKCGVPYLDTWTAVNGNPHISTWASAYQPDGLHFNINGMRRFVGTALIAKIKEIYPSLYWDYQFI